MYNAESLLATLSKDLALLPPHLRTIIKTAPLRYKTFFIPKKAGGMRQVAQPAREVKAIQRWLMRALDGRLPIHSAATAYRHGASIKKNAESHKESRYFLKLDFQNFFPSIQFQDIEQHLEKHCGDFLDGTARKIVARVSCWAPERQPPLRLCIGAPISPMLSNSLMYEFDALVANSAEDQGICYTRYADDLTLSSTEKFALEQYEDFVGQVLAKIEYPRLALNSQKTVRASRASKRVVTGLVLTPDAKISVGRDRKRLIRAMFHRAQRGELAGTELQELQGLLSFVESVEPGFSARLAERYPKA